MTSTYHERPARRNDFGLPEFRDLPLFAYLNSPPVPEPDGLTRGGRLVWRHKRCSAALANTIAALAGIGEEIDYAR